MSSKIPIGICLAVLIAVGGVMATKSDALTPILTDLQVIPRPERVTELFFDNYAQLPTHLKPNSVQEIVFSVRNQEQQQTSYSYSISVQPQSAEAIVLHQGEITLASGASQTINQNITVPDISGRANIRVDLHYPSQTTNHGATRQHQSISYWVALLPGGEQ